MPRVEPDDQLIVVNKHDSDLTQWAMMKNLKTNHILKTSRPLGNESFNLNGYKLQKSRGLYWTGGKLTFCVQN